MDYLGLFLLASLIVGMSKGGLTTAGALSVPFLSIWIDPLVAAGILLPVYLVSDVTGVWLYRREFSRPNVLLLIPAGLLGVIIATLLAPFVSANVAGLATGLIGLVYCGQAFAKRLRGRDNSRPFSIGRGIFWGALSGITSFISHTGAPPYQTFILPQKLSKMDYAGTTTIVFAAVNLFKLPAYASIGLMSDLHWPSILGMCGVASIGAVFGRRLAQWLRQEVYFTVIQVLLFIVSGYLVWKALAEIF